MICVMENNLIADNGAKRTPATPSFRFSADITERKYDARSCTTEFTVGQELGREKLTASVVRIGGQWTIVKSAGPKNIVVWGRITDEAPRIDVLNSYSDAQ